MATKLIPDLSATNSPLADGDLVVIEKADGSGTKKMTFAQLCQAVATKNYINNATTPSTTAYKALDARMGKTLNDSIDTLNSRLTSSEILPTNANLNDYKETGYTLYNAGYSDARTNAPSGWTGGLLLVYSSGGFAYQFCSNYTVGSTSVWFRKMYGSGWSSWIDVSETPLNDTICTKRIDGNTKQEFYTNLLAAVPHIERPTMVNAIWSGHDYSISFVEWLTTLNAKVYSFWATGTINICNFNGSTWTIKQVSLTTV